MLVTSQHASAFVRIRAFFRFHHQDNAKARAQKARCKTQANPYPLQMGCWTVFATQWQEKHSEETGLSSPSLFTALTTHICTCTMPTQLQLMSDCATSTSFYGILQQKLYYTLSGLSRLLWVTNSVCIAGRFF